MSSESEKSRAGKFRAENRRIIDEIINTPRLTPEQLKDKEMIDGMTSRIDTLLESNPEAWSDTDAGRISKLVALLEGGKRIDTTATVTTTPDQTRAYRVHSLVRTPRNPEGQGQELSWTQGDMDAIRTDVGSGYRHDPEQAENVARLTEELTQQGKEDAQNQAARKEQQLRDPVLPEAIIDDEDFEDESLGAMLGGATANEEIFVEAALKRGLPPLRGKHDLEIAQAGIEKGELQIPKKYRLGGVLRAIGIKSR